MITPLCGRFSDIYSPHDNNIVQVAKDALEYYDGQLLVSLKST